MVRSRRHVHGDGILMVQKSSAIAPELRFGGGTIIASPLVALKTRN
jgi:hypothetical protein